MDKKITEKLLELQIEFEMVKVQPENLKTTIELEIRTFYEWALDKKISDLVPKGRVIEKVKEGFKRISVSDANLILFKKYIKSNYKYFENKSIPLNSLLDKNEFFKYGNNALGLKEAREKGIHFVVNSSAYARMMSSIVYASIKDFLAENPLTKNNPVASSFMKIGQDFLNNLPGMQGNFDATITDFMRGSLSGRIQQSEKLIKEEMDSGKNTEELFNEVWNFLGTIKLSDMKNLVPEGEIIKLVDGIPDLIKFMKDNGEIENLILHNVEEFYNQYGDHSVKMVMNEWGVSGDELVVIYSDVLSAYLENDRFREFYRSRLYSRFSEFYNSEAVQKLFP